MGSSSPIRTVAPVAATSSATAGSGEPRIQTRLEGPATLIGPWRYSIAG